MTLLSGCPPKVFLLYRCSSGTCSSHDNSSNLPAIRKVILTFQVPMVILYLTSTLIVVTPVGYFSPPYWCATEGGVLVDPATTYPVWVEKWLSFHVAYHGQKKPWRSPSFSKPGLGSKFLLLDELPAKDKEPELPEPDILQVTWSFKWT